MKMNYAEKILAWMMMNHPSEICLMYNEADDYSLLRSTFDWAYSKLYHTVPYYGLPEKTEFFIAEVEEVEFFED